MLSPDADTGVEEFSITEDYRIDVVEFSPDPKSRLVAFSGKNELSLMHVDSKERQSVPVKYTYSLSFSQDGKVLACGLDGQVKLFEIPSLEPLETLKGSRGPVPNVSFSSDGMTLAIPNLGGFVQLWNRQVNAEVGRLPLPTDSMTAAKFSPDSSMLAVSTLGNGVYVFRVPTFEQITARHSREQSGAASP